MPGTWCFRWGVPSTPVPSACRCSPLGAASAQCHKNGTCVCKPGFMGYKCDRCQDNFFLTAGGTRCQECPSCYALVKEEVSPPYLPSLHTHTPQALMFCAGHREMSFTPSSQAFWDHWSPSACAHPAIGPRPAPLHPHLCRSLAPEWMGEKCLAPAVLPSTQAHVSHFLKFSGDETIDGPLWGGSGGGPCPFWGTSGILSRLLVWCRDEELELWGSPPQPHSLSPLAFGQFRCLSPIPQWTQACNPFPETGGGAEASLQSDGTLERYNDGR